MRVSVVGVNIMAGEWNFTLVIDYISVLPDVVDENLQSRLVTQGSSRRRAGRY
jgi:hypothetical protein